jgi:hypothetical protein
LEGERGDRTGKGIGWTVVAASMPVIRFGGDGKQRGEWAVKRGEKCGTVSRREGVIGASTAHVGSGGGGARLGFRRKKMAGRLTGWARLSVKGRRRGRLGQKGGGRDVDRGWARRGRERGGPWLGRKPEMAG